MVERPKFNFDEGICKMALDYTVKDISLGIWRRELNIAETEMPGLMALRRSMGVKSSRGPASSVRLI